MPVNGQFVRSCKQGALQFVIAKPILAIVQIVLYTQGAYRDGYWGPNNGCALCSFSVYKICFGSSYHLVYVSILLTVLQALWFLDTCRNICLAQAQPPAFVPHSALYLWLALVNVSIHNLMDSQCPSTVQSGYTIDACAPLICHCYIVGASSLVHVHRTCAPCFISPASNLMPPHAWP